MSSAVKAPAAPPSVLGMNLERPSSCPGSHRQLGVDQACLVVNNTYTESLTLWAQSDECYQVGTVLPDGFKSAQRREVLGKRCSCGSGYLVTVVLKPLYMLRCITLCGLDASGLVSPICCRMEQVFLDVPKIMADLKCLQWCGTYCAPSFSGSFPNAAHYRCS